MQNHQTSYPIPKNLTMEPQGTIKSQCCGMTMAVLACLSGFSFVCMGVAGILASKTTAVLFEYLFLAGYGAFYSYFYARITFDKQYCSGKPALTKIWPIVAAMVMAILGVIVLAIVGEPITITITININGNLTETFSRFHPILVCLLVTFLIAPLVTIISWVLYFGDDGEGDSRCLCFKPWRLIADPDLIFNPTQSSQDYKKFSTEKI